LKFGSKEGFEDICWRCELGNPKVKRNVIEKIFGRKKFLKFKSDTGIVRKIKFRPLQI